MDWDPIHKQARRDAGFNLADYDLAVREFSWDRRALSWTACPGVAV